MPAYRETLAPLSSNPGQREIERLTWGKSILESTKPGLADDLGRAQKEAPPPGDAAISNHCLSSRFQKRIGDLGSETTLQENRPAIQSGLPNLFGRKGCRKTWIAVEIRLIAHPVQSYVDHIPFEQVEQRVIYWRAWRRSDRP